jgi:hypothetical protein
VPAAHVGDDRWQVCPEALDQTREHVVRDGQQQQPGPLGHLERAEHGDARQEQGGPGPGGLADGRDADDLVPGALEGSTENGADPAGADDSHAQQRRGVHGGVRSSPLGYRSVASRA